MAETRFLLGYLCCLAFVTFVMTFFGFFPTVVRNVEANAGAFLDGFSSDPTLGPIVRYTAYAFGTSFSPVLALGHFIAIVISPIGLFTLLVYFLISWIMPAR